MNCGKISAAIDNSDFAYRWYWSFPDFLLMAKDAVTKRVRAASEKKEGFEDLNLLKVIVTLDNSKWFLRATELFSKFSTQVHLSQIPWRTSLFLSLWRLPSLVTPCTQLPACFGTWYPVRIVIWWIRGESANVKQPLWLVKWWHFPWPSWWWYAIRDSVASIVPN